MMLSPTSNDVSLEQLKNAEFPMLSILPSKLTVAKLEQDKNAESPIVVTLLGIVMLDN